MQRYIYQREATENGLYPYYIYDTKRANEKGRELARANEAAVAQKIVDAMNAMEHRRSAAA